MNLKHFESFDINWKVLQVRTQSAGPGRGMTKAKLTEKGKEHGGFKLVEGASLSIKEMLENPSYSDLVEGIRLRLVKIVRAYLDAGIITKEELEQPKEEKPEGKETKDEKQKGEEPEEEGRS